MGKFFDPDNLTEKQAANWDRAVHIYSEMRAKAEAKLPANLKSMFGMFWNPPGHEKSALFSRLLEGHDPLDFAPPKNHSYPWYALIEDGKQTAGIYFHKNELIIFQSRYKIISANKAGNALKSYAKRHLRKLKEARHCWNRNHRARIADLLAAGPEFIVKCNGYSFKVSYSAESSQRSGYRWCFTGSRNFMSDFSGGTPKVTRVIVTGEQSHNDHIKTYLLRKEMGDEQYAKQHKKMLLRDNVEPAEMPPEELYNNDWVDVTVAGFSIELI